MFHEPKLNNSHYNDCYFSYDDGLEEALYVFVDGNNIVERARDLDEITIAETGFGTGLNLLATIRALRENGINNKTITFITVEKYPLSSSRIEELVTHFRDSIEYELSFFLKEWDTLYPTLTAGWNSVTFTIDTIVVHLLLFYGDVSDFLQSIEQVPDCWYLDGHSPDKNPDMWNRDILLSVGKLSDERTTVATFSAAGIVKSGLREGGFFIKRRKGFGGKRHMVIGHYIGESLEI